MSLKAFHILFVSLSSLLGLGLGIWAIRDYTQKDEVGSLVVGILSLVACVGLLVYGRWFWRKLKGMNQV